MGILRFEDVPVWQQARELFQLVFRITSLKPFASDFRLRDQIRGSSGSIMDNIAEGFERGGNKEFIQFLSISKGSCGECRSQSYRAFDSGYINKQVLDVLVEKTTSLSRNLSGFMSYLKQSDLKGSKYK